MLIDLYDLPSEVPVVDADVCIVGAGAAGLSLARRLLDLGRRVLLLESGGRDYEAETARLSQGSSIGQPYYDLADARLRLFGGTTAIWGGRCAELDEIDFERRDWVPFSGWPFGKSTLAPYYQEAWSALGLRAPDGARLERSLLGDVPHWLNGDFDVGWWMFDRRADRYGCASQRELLEHPRLTVLLHASVTALHLDADLQTLDHLCIRSLRGHRGEVRAMHYVLAAGGLENPRLLLASDAQISGGVGNRHDLVGRFFMEHPHARGGRVHSNEDWALLRAFGSAHHSEGHPCAALLHPSEKLQRERRILNTSFTPCLRAHPQARMGVGASLYDAIKQRTEPNRFGRGSWRAYKAVKRGLKRISRPLQPWARMRLGVRGLYLSVRAEQAPNPDSRVLLSEQRDAFGMPGLVLDWRLGEIDRRTVSVMTEALGACLERRGIGSVEPASWLLADDAPWRFDPLISRHAIGGYHHMGTTRMADSPRCGVVDRDGRVHGTNNLWIAGSSVFPTSGWANPTLSIIALSLRLGDRLHQALADDFSRSFLTRRSPPPTATVAEPQALIV
jgi:choline dehydrogenase-like flavoprotein